VTDFMNAVRAEIAKLFSVRLWWILLLVLFGYVGFTAGILGGIFGAMGNLPNVRGPVLPTTGLNLLVYSVASSVGYVFPVLLGALATTTEFRNQTLTPTFLANPRRAQVLGAKALVLAFFGTVFGVVALVASMGIGGGLLAATGQDAAFGASATWVLVGRVVLAMAIWAVLGVGLGVLIPSQVGAIVVVLAFTQFVEPILRLGTSIWDWTAQIGKFLPGAASDALVGSSIFTSLGASTTKVAVLPWWQGGLVLLAYALVASVIGYNTSWRRDVT
jgi:ABC-2 type transport system permease protein